MTKVIEKPNVKPKEWISIGRNILPTDAVVCVVHEGDSTEGDLEVVYLDGSKAINDSVVWDKDHWRFKNSDPSGGYADNYSRLSEFVQILRTGRKYH